jgi:hypothetical protein
VRAYYQTGDVLRIGRRVLVGPRSERGTVTGIHDAWSYRVTHDSGREATYGVAAITPLHQSDRRARPIDVTYRGRVDQPHLAMEA